MSQRIDRSKSLQDLEASDWGDPKAAETAMIGRVLALRRKPLDQLSDGEVRLAVSQKVSLPLILDLAIERVRADPLLEADCYPGDLLAALARLSDADWIGRAEPKLIVSGLVREVLEQADSSADSFREALN
jgi:hypothetical protein